jgi:putative flippase GtrA
LSNEKQGPELRGTPLSVHKYELVRYLIAGFGAVGADLMTYWLLLPAINPSPAKAFSFVAGTIVAYALQKFWTFQQKEHSWGEITKFISLYSSSLLINVAVNRVSIYLVEAYIPQLQPLRYQFSWLLATGTSTVLNYVGQKFWVFKKRS